MSSANKLSVQADNIHEVVVKPADDLMTVEPHELAVSSAGQEQGTQKDIKDQDMVKDKSP